MNVGSLFSGIGGIDLGLERAGMRVSWQCEIDPWCRGILARHWPDTPQYGDIRTIDADTPRVDVLAGGFPCQPVSLAGKGLAQADERWLWPEFARCIRVLRPRYVIAENVPGLLTRGLDLVLADLAALGFDAEWTVFGARDVGAPHKRDRVWIVAADAACGGCERVPRIEGEGSAKRGRAAEDGAALAYASRAGDGERGQTDTKRATRPGAGGPTLNEAVGLGPLNPTWVEWLMGFPSGWTDSSPSVTPSSPNAPNTSDAS